MGGNFFYCEYHPTEATDSNLFWLAEYMKRNPDRQVMYKEQRSKVTSEYPDEKCDDNDIYYDDEGLPLFNPKLMVAPETIIKQLSQKKFKAICDPSLFEEATEPVATLVVKADKSAYIEIAVEHDNKLICYSISSLLDYYKGIRKPISMGTVTLQMDNFKNSQPDDERYWISSPRVIKAGLDARLKERGGKDAPRAIGLWLWDYVQEHRGGRSKGTVADAIRALKGQLWPEIIALGFAASEENVFRRLYRKTNESIAKCAVLSFK